MQTSLKIYVAGHRGMVGSAIVRALHAAGFDNITTRTHRELDLTNQQAVRDFLAATQPNQIYFAAARVGGIQANTTFPAEFIYQNLMMEANVIHEAWRAGITKLLFLGSSCIYPRLAPQPMAEEALLTGPLEATNEPYAVAKIAGIKLCESYNRQYGSSHGTDYRSVMPTNLYGPGDTYHSEYSHVIPALILRFHEAKTQGSPSTMIWGTGTPRREFLHVDDLAAACIHVMNLPRKMILQHISPMQSHINVGWGNDISIAELAATIARIVGYTGDLMFDASKPDGSPRKLLNSSMIRMLGWQPKIDLEQGLRQTYESFLQERG